MKFNKIILFFLLSINEINSTNFRNLIGIFDIDIKETPQNQKVALLFTTLAAIKQDDSIIILSPSLWNNFISRKNRFIKLNQNKFTDKYLYLDKIYPSVDPEKIAQAYQEYYKSYNNIIGFINAISQNYSDIYNNFKNTPKNDFIQKYEKNIFFDFICYKTEFNQDNWICKKNDKLILLIPKNYYKKIKSEVPKKFYDFINYKEIPADTDIINIITKNKNKISIQELLLGIKFDSLKDYNNPLETFENNQNKQYFKNIDPIKNLFITRNDLIDKKNPDSYKYELLLFDWFIYLDGHGSPIVFDKPKLNIEKIKKDPRLWGFICGIEAKPFYDLLKFFNYQINTKLLFYNTCFGAGMHADIISSLGVPEDKQFKEIILDVNYIIISGALTDSVTSSQYIFYKMPPYEDPAKVYLDFKKDSTNKLDLNFEYSANTKNFKLFFTELDGYFSTQTKEKIKKFKLIDIISRIHNFKKDKEYLSQFIYNIPLIRFPNTQWFRVTQINKYILSLTDFNIAIRKSKGIEELSLKTNKAILLYTEYIPFKINIKGLDTKFISMLSGPSKHVIEGIETNTLYNLFNTFFSIDYGHMEQYGYEKIFAIKKVIIKFPPPKKNYKNIIFAQRIILPGEAKPGNYFYLEEELANKEIKYYLYKIPAQNYSSNPINEEEFKKILQKPFPSNKQIIEQFRSYFYTKPEIIAEQEIKAAGFKKISEILEKKKKVIEQMGKKSLNSLLRDLNSNLIGLRKK